MQTINELEYLEISNKTSTLKIFLQGAHIFDFNVQGKKPLLFLSKTARFEKGVPIRGGIPICWPWFGVHPSDPSLPNHGLARTSLWKHVKTQDLSETKTQIIMSLSSSPSSLKIWPFDFELRLEIIMSDILEVSLITKNTGKNSFELTQALHTYLEVQDIHKTQVKGLEDKPFYNKLDNSFDNIQEGVLDFDTEIDRVYHDLSDPLILEDTNQKIKVQTIGSNTLVAWNPGSEFKNSFSDLSNYNNMLCLESANALKDSIRLEPQKVHVLKTIISQY